jgi:signal transduction histidine kinase
MEQVLANLLGNAAKYSAEGGRIMIRSSLVEKEIIVSVQDRGIGMSEEVLGSIFDKFYRDKQVLATHAGLGMGLYIASKIVVEHGGKIWVESTPGQGSVFHFSIPCC